MKIMALKMLTGMAGVGIAALLAAYWIFTGPENLDQYPPAGESPYLLPWPAGTTYLCVQSNRVLPGRSIGLGFAAGRRCLQ